MASHTPGAQPEKSRHRITNIKLEPSTSKYDISLKILVDGQEPCRLPVIQRGELLSWDKVPLWDVESTSRLELRVYKKHLFGGKRVGTLKYIVSTFTDQLEARIELDTRQFTVVLSFPTPDEAQKAPATALANAQEKKTNTRPLQRLGPTRDALKAILDFGEAVSELHPVAKAAFGICKIAWQTLEKQELCDANIEELVVGLAGLLPVVERVKIAARLPHLQDAVAKMMNLIEDASRFVIEYRSDGGLVQSLRAVAGSKAQDQVQDLLGKFKRLKEDLDRGVGIQTLETVDTIHKTIDEVHEVLLTAAQRALLNELKPVGSARYDPSRACLLGTRTVIIKEIVDWSQRRGADEGLLWLHGHAGLGKSSIASSICQELDERKLLAGEFFCKRDSSERRDPQQVLTTIVYALASRHSGYAKSVIEAIQGDPRLCTSPIQMQYNNLVKSPLETLVQTIPPANLVTVVDALDECGTSESRRRLLAYLHLMSQLVPWLKIVVTSRPDPDIWMFFNNTATSGVSRRDVYEYDASEDIASFIQQHMLDNPKSKHLPTDATILLTKRAAGLFIWAKTACELILNSHDPESRFRLVIGDRGLNQGSNPLDTLYTTAIETSLGVGGTDDAQHVQECLGAIIVCSARTPLSVPSLSGLLGNRVKMSVLQSVVDSLGSVLYIDYTQGGVVRVYHHSFTDYMTSSVRSGRFCVDLERQNTDFARCCLRTMIDGLRFNICRLETSYILNREVPDLGARIDAEISLHLRYSCHYWTSHLIQSKRGVLEKLLREFLLRPTVLYWIEVLSLLGKLGVAMFNALELSKWYQGSEDISECARDTHRFILAFYDPISKSTPHLYVSAVAFCPTRIAFIQRLRATFQNTLAITRGAREGWSPWLRCISHPATVLSVALSGDGRLVVSGSSDSTVRVWDADTGEALGSPLVGHSGGVMSVGFSPDGRRIVSGSDDKTVRVWDADTGAALSSPLEGHSDWVSSVGFSPDGRCIVSGSYDSTMRVWDAETGGALGSPLEGHSGPVRSIGFSPGGHRIVSGSDDRTVRVWDTQTGKALGSPLEGHSGSVRSVRFSPDGLRIVSGSNDKTVRLWNAETGDAHGSPLEGHSGPVQSIGFSPDGRRIVSGSSDRTIQVWDANTGDALGSPLRGHLERIGSVGFSPDGRRIVSGSDDNTVRVWDANTGKAFGSPPEGHLGPVRSIGFSPDGRRIVSGSDDKTVRVWDADTGAALSSPLEGHSDRVNSVGFSPNGRRIVSGSLDNTVRVWDADTGEALGSPLVGHSGGVMSVGFSPDGRCIVSGSLDNTVRVWDADTGEARTSSLEGHSGPVLSVEFSPDSRRIVSGSLNNAVRVWDAGTGDALSNPLEGHSDRVNSVGFSPNGRCIVSGSSDNTVRVWDADTGELFGVSLVEYSGGVMSVGFSPDGRRIVSGSSDSTVQLWDANTGEAFGSPLEGHSGPVLSVGFSPDGCRIASGSSDNTVRVWSAVSTYPSSLPHNTSYMSDSLSSDGWVRNATTDELLLWLPEEYRRYDVDGSLFVISNDPVPIPVPIDSSRFAYGPDWKSVYTPQLA